MPDGGKLTRRTMLAALGSSAGLAAALSNNTNNSGNLYGGTMALDEAHNVAGDLWIGPDSAKSNVDATDGRVYKASDTQVEYWGDNGAWKKMGVGSQSEPVGSVHTEQLSNIYVARAGDKDSVDAKIAEAKSDGGGRVLMPPGDYIVPGGEPIWVDGDNITLWGCGPDTRILLDGDMLNGNSDGAPVHVNEVDTNGTPPENVTVGNFLIDGQGNQATAGLWFHYAKRSLLTRVWTTNIDTTGSFSPTGAFVDFGSEITQSDMTDCYAWKGPNGDSGEGLFNVNGGDPAVDEPSYTCTASRLGAFNSASFPSGNADAIRVNQGATLESAVIVDGELHVKGGPRRARAINPEIYKYNATDANVGVRITDKDNRVVEPHVDGGDPAISIEAEGGECEGGYVFGAPKAVSIDAAKGEVRGLRTRNCGPLQTNYPSSTIAECTIRLPSGSYGVIIDGRNREVNRVRVQENEIFDENANLTSDIESLNQATTGANNNQVLDNRISGAGVVVNSSTNVRNNF